MKKESKKEEKEIIRDEEWEGEREDGSEWERHDKEQVWC